MIISASRRTDIPAFYSAWMVERLRQGFVYVRNPRNPHRLGLVQLNPDIVDWIVFWTKNARPMLDKLEIINAMGYDYYFQFTLTPYGNDLEKGLPPKSQIIESFKRLSDMIGKHRVVWRYDPIIVNKTLSVQYHLDQFEKMSRALGAYTDQCIFSFIDLYAGMRKRARGIAEEEVSHANRHFLAQGLSKIAGNYGFDLAACAEEDDFSFYGINPASCIDKSRIEKLTGCCLDAKKDKNQRPACNCMESIDIGSYDSCAHGCVYCYAVSSEMLAEQNMRLHDPRSPLLVSSLNGDELITAREAKSCKIKTRQDSLF